MNRSSEDPAVTPPGEAMTGSWLRWFRGRSRPTGSASAGTLALLSLLVVFAVLGTALPAAGTNTAPTAAHNTVTTAEDMAYTFTADDFGFMDADAGDTLAIVKIWSSQWRGTLALDGVAINWYAVVTKAQIDGKMLTFTPARDAHGDPYVSFSFRVNDGTDDSAERLHDAHRRDGRPRPRLRGAQLRRPAQHLDRYGDGGNVQIWGVPP